MADMRLALTAPADRPQAGTRHLPGAHAIGGQAELALVKDRAEPADNTLALPELYLPHDLSLADSQAAGKRQIRPFI